MRRNETNFKVWWFDNISVRSIHQKLWRKIFEPKIPDLLLTTSLCNWISPEGNTHTHSELSSTSQTKDERKAHGMRDWCPATFTRDRKQEKWEWKKTTNTNSHDVFYRVRTTFKVNAHCAHTNRPTKKTKWSRRRLVKCFTKMTMPAAKWLNHHSQLQVHSLYCTYKFFERRERKKV